MVKATHERTVKGEATEDSTSLTDNEQEQTLFLGYLDTSTSSQSQ